MVQVVHAKHMQGPSQTPASFGSGEPQALHVTSHQMIPEHIAGSKS